MRLLFTLIFLLFAVTVSAEDEWCPTDLTIKNQLPDLSKSESADEFRIYTCDGFDMFAPDPIAIYRVLPKYDDKWFDIPRLNSSKQIEGIPVREFTVPNKFEQIFPFISWKTYSNQKVTDGVGYFLEYRWRGKYGTLGFGNPHSAESQDAQMFSRLLNLLKKQK